ncbi:hypothetical protein JCM33374_g4162 [Metschnikowia sp. JCM 33374]|nr:hypothetical protein JCM33374_g4162 [Metschnikowia sp. JCM 33374]
MADPIRCAYTSQDVEPFYIGATSAVFARDAPIVATPMNENVVVTNLATDAVLHTLEGDGETVTALALTPDGSRLAVVSQSQQLRIYDVSKGDIVKQYKFSAPVYIATADETSTLFAFGATDGLVCVWDIAGGYVTHSLKGHGTTICSLAFHGELHSADWMLASGDTMGTCKVWDLVRRKCVATSNEHGGAVRGVAFSADGEYFMTGGRDEVVVIYKKNALRNIVNTFSVRHQVEKCGFITFEDQKFFYTAGSECHLKIWDIDTGRPMGGSRRPLETSEELMVIDVAETDDGDTLWMVLSDQTLVELDVADPQIIGSEIHIPISRHIAGNHGIIADIRYAGPNLDMVAMATNAPALRVVDPSHPLNVQLCEGHTDLLNCLDVSEDGLWILTGSKDNEARLWRYDDETESFDVFCTFTGHAGAVTACGLPKNISTNTGEVPRFVITASADLTVKKWKVPREVGATVKTSEFTRRAHDKDINAVAIAPNDEFFATASFDKTAKIWNMDTGETVGILRGHKRGLWDISFCQYDKLVATSSGDKSVKVWSLNDYSCTKTLEGHTNAVQRCKFANKNKQIISCGADGLVKVWDIKESECVATLDNHSNRIWALDVKNDGLSVVSADADGYLSFWTDNTDELMLQREEKEKERVEQEQSLTNYINKNEWSNAFLLALTLEHSMRVYNVVKASIAANDDQESAVGSKELESTMKQLETSQMVSLLKKIRDWNINFKQFEIAQKVLSVIIDKINMEDGDTRKIVDSIIPYNERHFSRLDDMLEETYILDYVVQEMEKA